jgi:hypothetical protein
LNLRGGGGGRQEAGENCKMRSFTILQQLHRVIKSIMMRRKGHVEHMGEITNAYKTWVTKIKDEMSLQRRVEGSIIFKKRYRNFESWLGKEISLSKKIRTGSGAHAASFSTRTGFYPSVKRLGSAVNHSPHLMTRIRMSWAIHLLTYIHTYIPTYILTDLLTYLLIYLLHGAESLRS